MRGERLRANAAHQKSMLRKPKAKCDLYIYKYCNKADRFFFPMEIKTYFFGLWEQQ